MTVSNNIQYLDSVSKVEFLLETSGNAWRQLGVTPLEEFIEQLKKEESK